MNRTEGISPFIWILVVAGVFVLLFFLVTLIPRSSNVPEMEISHILQMAEDGQVAEIEVRGDDLRVTTTSGLTYRSHKESGVSILELLRERGVPTGDKGVKVVAKEEGRGFLSVLLSFLPWIVFSVLFVYMFSMFRRASGTTDRMFDIGKTQARVARENRPPVTFDDVAGVDESKEELAEIVEFLRHPFKFARLGAKIPRGVLLAGPPGTGKTLLAKAVAGEAGVPFFSINGSEFVQVFVGVGASRVRDLFKQARENAPAIVFIDEIDAVGRRRGAGIGGGNDEREQTLNQILSEMDGFDARTNVIVLAATNRPDVLDPALLRPGRFDRQVVLPLPDARGREAILRIHLQGKPVTEEADLPVLARETYGFSGADLANLVNEAAILAAREERDIIGLQHLEEALERVTAGPARKSREVSEKEREIVAYHEAGHALVAAHVPEADPVYKVTIVARGAAGGYTRTLPERDRDLWSKGQFEAMLAVMMGGQTAEQLVFGDITTGASNDLQSASKIARKMVTEFGMSAELGPRSFDTGEEMVFLGKILSQDPSYSDAVAEKIDQEIGKLLDKARQRAMGIIEANRSKLTLLAERLLVEETIQGPELRELLTGHLNKEVQPAETVG